MTRGEDLVRAQLVDAVMARVVTEPIPAPGRAFAAAVRRRAPVQAFTALATAWRLATLRTRPVPLVTRVRAGTLALGVGGLLAASSAVALASVASVTQHVVADLVGTPRAEPARPLASPASSATDRPSGRPILTVPSFEPGGSEPPRPRPSVSTAPTPAPGRTSRPTTRPGHGDGGSGDGGSGDGGGSTPRPTATPDGNDGSGDGGSDTPRTPTPRPTSTPTRTPAPEATDQAPDGGSSSSGDGSSG